jgi:hypothetical protein
MQKIKTFKHLIWIHSAVLIAVIVVLSRCGSNSSTSPETAASFTYVWQNTISTTCQSCHLPGGSASITCAGIKVDFTSQGSAYNTLVGVGGVPAKPVCKDVLPQCANVAFVAPGNPGTSYMEYLVDPAYTGQIPGTSCTSYAHQVLVPGISANNLAAIKSWITSNALND